MKTLNKRAVAAIAGLMTAASLGVTAFAAGTETTVPEKTAVVTKTAADATSPYATQKELLKTADAALATLTNVRSARKALFDNDIETAKTDLAKATKALTEGEADLKALHVADTDKTNGKAEYLPFDMSMMLTDNFQPTAENKEALQKAGSLMQSGDKDNAIEVLRVASVDLNISAALLPDTPSAASLKKAAEMIDGKNFFGANLELKAIEDSVIVRTFGINAIPVQGNAG